jgi:hypothetical protein
MPEFKDSVAAEQAEELVTTADFSPKPPVRRRRRHPIGRGNAGGRAHPSNIGPWDGSGGRDVVQERLDRLATADKPAESCCAHGDAKYSTEVVGKPSPHRREDSAPHPRGKHAGPGCCCRGAHPQEKNCSCGKGILQKVLGAIWPFKRPQKEQETDTGEKSVRPPQRGSGGGGRYFRQRNRSTHHRPRSPGA